MFGKGGGYGPAWDPWTLATAKGGEWASPYGDASEGHVKASLAEAMQDDWAKWEVVEKVKMIQRESEMGKEIWWKYCDSKKPGFHAGPGHRDPARHEVEFLQHFVDCWMRGEEPNPTIGGAGTGGGKVGGVLKLRGLPFSATKAEVAEFLQAYEVLPDNVCIGINLEGRPSGEALVTVATPDIAARALQEMQKQNLGGRYIEIYPTSYDEWQKWSKGKGGGKMPGGKGAGEGWGGFKGNTWEAMMTAKGEWLSSNPWAAMFLKGSGSGKGKGWDDWTGGMGWDKGGGKGGSGGGDWIDPADMAHLVDSVKSIQKSGDSEKQKWWQYVEAHGLNTFDPGRHRPEFLRAFLRDYHTANQGCEREPWVHPSKRGNSAYDGMPDDGKVVRMRGVPFGASKQDIAAFFGQYGVDESQVAIKMGDDGRPTGETFTIFASPELAQHAILALNKASMGQRYVELFKSNYQEWGAATGEGSGGKGSKGPVGDPCTEEQVNAIKAIQRTGEEAKQKWWAFVDQQRDVSGYDPKRHSAQFLTAFVVAYHNGTI